MLHIHYSFIRNILVLLCAISFMVMLVAMHSYGILPSLTSYVLMIYLVLSYLVHIPSTLILSFPMFIFPIVLYFIVLISSLYIAYQISISKEPENVSRSKIIPYCFYYLEKIVYKLNIVIIPIVYIVFIIFTILIFALLYDHINNIGKGVEGIYYSAIGNNGKRMTITKWDPLYFSSSTFFTVGYGDIIPIGNVVKLLSQIEVLIGHVLSVVYAAIMVNFLLRRFKYDS